MSTGYQIYDKAGSYFLTFQVVDWVDVFTRKIYRDIVLDSFEYCRKNKGLLVQPPKIRTKLQRIIKNKTSVLSLRWQG